MGTPGRYRPAMIKPRSERRYWGLAAQQPLNGNDASTDERQHFTGGWKK